MELVLRQRVREAVDHLLFVDGRLPELLRVVGTADVVVVLDFLARHVGAVDHDGDGQAAVDDGVDARMDVERDVVFLDDEERFVEEFLQTRFERLVRRLEHGEMVAEEPRNECSRMAPLADGLRDGDEHFVALFHAVEVVDHVELAQVDGDHREIRVRLRGELGADGAREAFFVE